jgi:ring-1,2-phenylacetyl-CoA epoxidase subunit PaaD
MVKVQDEPSNVLEQTSQTVQQLFASIWLWLENVCDPEVPVLSILDLGIVRGISLKTELGESFHQTVPDSAEILLNTIAPPFSVLIHLSPTYTGCPAMSMIAANIKLELNIHGIDNVQIKEELSPAWTSDWMSEAGKQKLLEYGIAPPQGKARVDKLLFSDQPITCPLCRSNNTERISEFGSTACKSLHRCLDCREPFDYFKCH